MMHYQDGLKALNLKDMLQVLFSKVGSLNRANLIVSLFSKLLSQIVGKKKLKLCLQMPVSIFMTARAVERY
jgi:hypothetical protein